MRVVFIVRSNLYAAKGGDTVQVQETAEQLMSIGVSVDIKLTNETIDYLTYDLLHFFNIIRPADILIHIKRSNKPYVISTIFVDYSEFDKNHRKGFSGLLFKFFSPGFIEYVKALGRSVKGNDRLVSKEYLWLGQKRSIQKVLTGASYLLPNSESEYDRIKRNFAVTKNYRVVPNGVSKLFIENNESEEKDVNMVICVARIEGIKNQLNLIKALRNTSFKLFLIGGSSSNQERYHKQCKRSATSNITFIEHVAQADLIKFYKKAKVHILPSWFETTGLSSLEAAVSGCNVIITDRGDAKEYLGKYAFYCDPGLPHSIFEAVNAASKAPVDPCLAETIKRNYTWKNAAEETYQVYKEVLKNDN